MGLKATISYEEIESSPTNAEARDVWSLPDESTHTNLPEEIDKTNHTTFISSQSEIESKAPYHRKFVVLPRNADIASSYKVLGKWHCYVTEIGDTSFKAIASDIQNASDDIVAEFEKSEIAEGDLPLLQEGAIFYWSIYFYQDAISGSHSRQSEILFRRFKSVDRTTISRARELAELIDENTAWSKPQA
jgi:hypothetical protein